MNFLSISEILNLLAGTTDDEFINMRLNELDIKLDSLRELIRLHDQSGTPSLSCIVETLRHELMEGTSHA